MQRRDFIYTMGAAAAGGMFARAPFGAAKKLDHIGLETYAVRHAMAQDPDRTLAAVRAIGYTDVELLWSFNLFGRSPAQVAATLKNEGLRAPSAHMSADTIFVGWERSLETAKLLGHQYLFVPDFEDWTKQTLDDWREWADRFNAAGAVARRAGIWLGFHNEAYHQKPIAGQIPFDVFINRLDPSVTRLQLDVGNMLIGAAIRCSTCRNIPTDSRASISRTRRPIAPTIPASARESSISRSSWPRCRRWTRSPRTSSRKRRATRTATSPTRAPTTSTSGDWNSDPSAARNRGCVPGFAGEQHPQFAEDGRDLVGPHRNRLQRRPPFRSAQLVARWALLAHQ